MEKVFRFSTLLQSQNNANKHKSKPAQFGSVAEGTKKRLETNLKTRRSSRLTVFDNFRSLPKCKTPVPVVLNKIDQRKLQLQKWKEEKEKKKREAQMQKKKPFLLGAPKNPLQFEYLPAVLKPSTSGRVTRLQYAKQSITDKKEELQSFAPINAKFNPMLHLDIVEIPQFGESTKPNSLVLSPSGTEPKQSSLRTRSKCMYNNNSSVQKQITKKTEPIVVKKSMPKTTAVKKTTQHKKEIELKQDLCSDDTLTDSPSSSMEKNKKELLAESKAKSNQNKKNKKSSKKTTYNKQLVNTSESLPSTETDIYESTSLQKHTSKKKSTPNQNVTLKRNDQDLITFSPSVPKSESSSEEKLRSPKSPNLLLTPQQIKEEAKKISPRVYLSRGKGNTRREMLERIKEGLLDEDLSEMSVDHFRRQMDSETKRMTEMCDTWDQISEQVTLPDDAQEAVLAAVGQARLLMSQKFQQFASLVCRCERPEPGQALVTLRDLQGFWDMVFKQVENIDMRFKQLELSRARGWAEDQPVVRLKRLPPKAAARAGRPAAPGRPAAASRLKDIIAAARKAKNDNTKTFDAGFFSVQSPVKSPESVCTPSKQPSLLKDVLSNEARKASAKKISYAVLHASCIAKHIDQEQPSNREVNADLTPIDLGVTPGRSILKSNNNSVKKAANKSIKLVLFDDADVSSSDILKESNKTEQEIPWVEKLDNVNVASSSVGAIEKDAEEKENRRSSRRSKPVRQDAVEQDSPIMTRSRRKSRQTPARFGDLEIIKQSSRRKKTVVTKEDTPTTSRSRRRV